MGHFSYIVTCHNSEALIERVIEGILRCWGPHSTDGFWPVFVLDECTDRTEDLLHTRMPTAWTYRVVKTNDVHELLSINAGLRAAPQDGDGFNIILQDDVILEEPRLEEMVEDLYARIPNLGYLSFRLGHNLGPDDGTNPYLIQRDEIESAYGAGVAAGPLMPYTLVFRAVAVKSPVCMPCKLVRELGMLDEELAPYAYDDVDFSLRAIQAGYRNAVFSIPFRSDIKWGGTRKPGHPDIMVALRKNAAYLRKKHGGALMAGVVDGNSITEPSRVLFDGADNEGAMQRWRESQQGLKEFTSR